MDAEVFSATLDNIGALSSKGTYVDLTTKDGRRYSDVVLVSYRVVSVTGGEARTSGAASCTSFDFQIYDRDKGSWSSPSAIGLLVDDLASTAGYTLQTSLNTLYQEQGGKPRMWFRIKNNGATGPCDFNVDVWVRPVDSPFISQRVEADKPYSMWSGL